MSVTIEECGGTCWMWDNSTCLKDPTINVTSCSCIGFTYNPYIEFQVPRRMPWPCTLVLATEELPPVQDSTREEYGYLHCIKGRNRSSKLV